MDYLVVGAGATGMGFVDTMLTETGATIALVDRRDRPGGHWNDAYPFVRLHQPAAFYGVSSMQLGSGATDAVGLNAGLHTLASGAEVLSHFDHVLRQRFLPSGRVRYFPMSEVGDDGSIRNLLSGRTTTVRARKLVDATYSQVAVPSTHTPQFAVSAGVTCVPVNELPRLAADRPGYVVIGAGKTGIDACIWLLENGAEPDSIRWVMPRDPWLLARERSQPGTRHLALAVRSAADQVEALADAVSVEDVFARLEAADDVRRIDVSQQPGAYHCATVSMPELEQLRRIRHVVRLGRVTSIAVDRSTLDHGVIETGPGWLHVDCSACALTVRPAVPAFAGDRITLQNIRLCQPTFSAALIAHVEAMHDDDAEKNRLCRPMPPPDVPSDWLRLMQVELANRLAWSRQPEVDRWLQETPGPVRQAVVRAQARGRGDRRPAAPVRRARARRGGQPPTTARGDEQCADLVERRTCPRRVVPPDPMTSLREAAGQAGPHVMGGAGHAPGAPSARAPQT